MKKTTPEIEKKLPLTYYFAEKVIDNTTDKFRLTTKKGLKEKRFFYKSISKF